MSLNLIRSIRLKALGELLGRYGVAFADAWQHRADMHGGKRLAHEAQFLPAALSLQETPVSPAPRVAMWMLIVFAALAVLWASVGSIDVVATAQGKVVPSDRVKTIQSLETATVKAIHVAEGQLVKAGDVLIELDATAAQADQDRVQSELGTAQLQLGRGRALLAALDDGHVPKLERPPRIEDAKFAQAQSLLAGQLAEVAAKEGRIASEIAKREAELHSTQEMVRKLELTAPIAKQRAEDFKNLVDQNFVSKHGYLEREQARIELEADLATVRSRLKEVEAALREARGQRSELIAETRRLSLDSVADGYQKVAALEQDLLKARAREKLLRLTAPVDGTVQQLVVHTISGVVTSAQPLMVIVPRDHPLEVEAFLENKDVGFVRVGDASEVKVETFPYTKYGTIRATVSAVSHDAINDEKRGLVYAVRVALDATSLNVDGLSVRLSPGMAVSVEIKTGRRQVLDYFLAPLMQHAKESLRER